MIKIIIKIIYFLDKIKHILEKRKYEKIVKKNVCSWHSCCARKLPNGNYKESHSFIDIPEEYDNDIVRNIIEEKYNYLYDLHN